MLRDQRAGGVVLLGTWNGASTVGAATRHWQPVGSTASGGIGVLVAADQEGGQVRHLQGAGFTATPSALSQGRAGTAGATAATVAAELKAVGVNVDLAPVADTVAASFAPRNAPIGAYQREYGNDPATVSKAVVAAVGGYQDGGISATLKHFPGLGRVTGNTDLTANGTTDTTTTADDAYLEPFRAGHPGRRRPGHGVVRALPEARPRRPRGVLPAGRHRPAPRDAGLLRRRHLRRPRRGRRRRRHPGGRAGHEVRRRGGRHRPDRPGPDRADDGPRPARQGGRRTRRSPPRSTPPPRGSSSSRPNGGSRPARPSAAPHTRRGRRSSPRTRCPGPRGRPRTRGAGAGRRPSPRRTPPRCSPTAGYA